MQDSCPFLNMLEDIMETYHGNIQFERKNSQWLCLGWNFQGNIWTQWSCPYYIWQTCGIFTSSWICFFQNQSRFMEAWVQKSVFCIMCRWFWCQELVECATATVSKTVWLVREWISWIDFRLALWRRLHCFVDERVHQSSRHKFQHPDPKLPQHCPHPYWEIQYGAKIQYADAPKLQQEKSRLLLDYYCTMHKPSILQYCLLWIHCLINNHSQQKPPKISYAIVRLNQCKCSDMILYIHSDAAYLLQATIEDKVPPINGAVSVECKKLDWNRWTL